MFTFGMLVTIEGIDGSGKSTICSMLQDRLDYLPIQMTREPRYLRKEIGEAMERCDHRGAYNLFLEDHQMHTERIVIPALDEGDILISDRYLHSRIAYQTATLTGEGVYDAEQRIIDDHAKSIIPDIMFYIDIDPKIALNRIGVRDFQTKYEEFGLLTRIRENYLRLCRNKTLCKRVYILDGTDNPTTLCDQIERIVNRAWDTVEKNADNATYIDPDGYCRRNFP